MLSEVRIVGQGIAGSMLGWACERAGIPFRIYDPGHAAAASRVGAGLVSPLTGQRLVPTWRFAEWRNDVREIYRDLENELGRPLVREMVIHRRFRDARQRELFLSRIDRPEVAPWVESVHEHQIILHGTLQVNTAALIECLRRRWLEQGRLQERTFTEASSSASAPVIWCTGAVLPPGLPLPWEPSRGEIIRGKIPGLLPHVVLNAGHWVLPEVDDQVIVGALFDRAQLDAGVTESGQAELRQAAMHLTGAPVQAARGDSGLRVNLRDRRPVVGWWDESKQIGVFGGLAAKGALWAPGLAAQWTRDQLAGGSIDPAARVDRWLRSSNSAGHSS